MTPTAFPHGVDRQIGQKLYQRPHTHLELVATIDHRPLTIHAAISRLRRKGLITGYRTTSDPPNTMYVLTERGYRRTEAHS